MIQDSLYYIENHLHEEIGLEDVASEALRNKKSNRAVIFKRKEGWELWYNAGVEWS